MAGAIHSKKIGSCFEWLELSVQNKLGAVQTAGAMPFKKVVSCLNWMFVAICFETVAYNSFGRDVSIRNPVKVNSLRTAISQEYIGQTKVSLE